MSEAIRRSRLSTDPYVSQRTLIYCPYLNHNLPSPLPPLSQNTFHTVLVQLRLAMKARQRRRATYAWPRIVHIRLHSMDECAVSWTDFGGLSKPSLCTFTIRPEDKKITIKLKVNGILFKFNFRKEFILGFGRFRSVFLEKKSLSRVRTLSLSRLTAILIISTHHIPPHIRVYAVCAAWRGRFAFPWDFGGHVSYSWADVGAVCRKRMKRVEWN